MKSVFIVCAAAGLLAEASVAQATELPSRRAPQTDSATACDAYGAGFVRAPGTGLCVKVSGAASAEVVTRGGSSRH